MSLFSLILYVVVCGLRLLSWFRFGLSFGFDWRLLRLGLGYGRLRLRFDGGCLLVDLSVAVWSPDSAGGLSDGDWEAAASSDSVSGFSDVSESAGSALS